MKYGFWPRSLIAGLIAAALVPAPSLLPKSGLADFGGAALAQGYADVGYFYDELGQFGQWAWHPRFGYVWLPETVSPYWRPYTVGRWIYTAEYGWYWDSHEPFAWAVYHYGRWGYDPDYGWFWVPGDVWAPAWVQWRYSDNFVGWAPIGPGRQGYAYGAPVSFEPPIAEAWVFVNPRYMTSRAVGNYALPIGALGPAFFGATTVYRPEFRGGVVYNFGMPRDRVSRIMRRPIVVEKVYRFDRKDKWERGNVKGVKIYAPGFGRSDRPQRPPKRFVDHPNDFKPKARLKEVYRGDVPKGWGPSAKSMKSITKEAGPDAWKKQHGDFDRDGPGRGGPDRDKGKDWNKGQAARDQDFDQRGQGGPGGPGSPGGPGWNGGPGAGGSGAGGPGGPGWNGGPGAGGPGGPGSPGGQGGPGWKQGKPQFGDPGMQGRAPDEASEFDQFDQGNQGAGKRNKTKPQFGDPGMPGMGQGGGQNPQGGDQGGGGGADGKNKKKQAKCEKNPDHPGCQ